MTVSWLIAAMIGIGVILDNVEVLLNIGAYRNGGPLALTSINRLRPQIVSRHPIPQILWSYPAVLISTVTQILAAVAVELLLTRPQTTHSGSSPAVTTAMALILLLRAVEYSRDRYAQNGADQMMYVVCAGVGLSFASTDNSARLVGLGFIAGQYVLAMLTSGIAKLLSPVWRGGRALPMIFRTQSLGQPHIYRLLQRHPRCSTIGCWSVIAVETAGVLAVPAGPPAVYAIVAIYLSMHLVIALTMGLAGFFWTFGAAALSLIAASSILWTFLRG